LVRNFSDFIKKTEEMINKDNKESRKNKLKTELEQILELKQRKKKSVSEAFAL